MRIWFAVVCLMAYGTCAFGADGSGDERIQEARKRCERMSSIIGKTAEMRKLKASDGDICIALKKNFSVSDDTCKAAVEQAKDIQNALKSDDPAKAKESYFDACFEAEQERISKNPKKNVDVGGFATAKDLHGAYELVEQPEWFDKATNKVPDPFEEKYQYFIFAEDGQFSYISSSKKIGDVKTRKDVQELVDMMKKFPRGGQTYYRFLQDGFIVLYHKEKPNFGIVWGVNTVKSHWDSGKGLVWEPGDILMSMDDDGKVVYRKQLRPLKE